MPKYVAVRDTWLSHECRLVKAGEEFTTEFPTGPGGKPMTLGENIKLAEESKPAPKAAKAAASGDGLV